MGKHNSPDYELGRQDGAADTATIALCPPGQPMGPQPPHPEYPVMYMRGYRETFIPEARHQCTKECKKEG